MKELSAYIKIEEGKIHYEDAEGHYYDNMTDFLQSYILGFCCCGDPESILEFIYGLLKLKKEWSSDDHIKYEEYSEKLKKYLLENIDTIQWYFEYLLDKKNVTEHGGNVSGSWLSDNNLYNALEIWHKENINHDQK